MSNIINGLLYAFKKNLEYAPKLVADLSEAQMTAQPAADVSAPANHPAWVFSHLNIYLPIIEAIIEGEEFEDPREHPFGMLSKPSPDRSLYAAKQELVETFVSGHEQIIGRLEASDDSVFDTEVKLPRWQSLMPNAGIALPYLMLNHENLHLGQLSAWRRIQGLPSV